MLVIHPLPLPYLLVYTTSPSGLDMFALYHELH
jgi:hypothetical protein